jgi:hypothetical protein
MDQETTVVKLFLGSLLRKLSGMGSSIQEMVVPYKVVRLLFHLGYHPNPA